MAAYAFALLIGLAVVGWVAARQIRSPAEVAAQTAAPSAAPITVPVVRRTLSTEVIVRGTVRYGAPQAVVLGTSALKQGGEVVTRPPSKGARLKPGDVAMTVDGRPVFVFGGTIPMHRDLHRGSQGPDVRQLERALVALGYSPGRVDGTYDSATANAVGAFYVDRGWEPFGTTDAQRDALRTAESTAAAAREIDVQSRADAVSARETLDGARLDVSSAKRKLASARDAANAAAGNPALAQANNRKDRTAANADVAAKLAAFKSAVMEQQLARIRFGELDRNASAAEQATASAAIRQAADEVRRTQAELQAARAARDATRVGASGLVRTARNESAQARRDVGVAKSELLRARRAVSTARARVRLAHLRTRRTDGDSPAGEARRARSERLRLAGQEGVQVPANEVLFLGTLPLRIDSSRVKRGAAVEGPVMRVTNSKLAIDSSLAVADAKLVRLGDPVTIEEQELGVKSPGVVTHVATAPGTNGADPTRFSFTIVPAGGFPSLVGNSVKLTIDVKSTRGEVLAVPPSALSVGGNGDSRLQVRRRGRTELINVVPGLAAEGLVEIRPAGRVRLLPGDLVIVGSRAGGRVP